MSIPKIIHYCWFGGGELPDRDKKCIESWRRYCPDYEIVEWNENNYDVTQVTYMKEAYDAKRWGFVPDFIRMDLVYRFGGIYMDTDVELIRSLDPLLEYEGFIGIEAESGCIGLGCGFGAEKGNVILKELCDYYHTLRFINEDGTLNMTPNPIIVTEFLKEQGYKITPGEISMLGSFTVFPEEYFCPQAFSSGKIQITNNTYSIHHYHASWQTEPEKKELKKYHNYTKIFGNQLGELFYQTGKVLRTEGIMMVFRKIFRYLKNNR